MTLVRWNPWGELQNVQERMNTLFEDLFPASHSFNAGFGAWPHVDVREDAQAFTVEVDLPGMKREDIQVEVVGETLYLKGERKREEEKQGDGYHLRERHYGAFQRAFTLPTSVDADKVKGEYRDGTLRLTLPKSEAVRPKRIAIES